MPLRRGAKILWQSVFIAAMWKSDGPLHERDNIVEIVKHTIAAFLLIVSIPHTHSLSSN